MKKKILFAENIEYYKELGVITEKLKENYILVFNGGKLYKKPDRLKNYSLIVSCLYHSPLSNFLIIQANKEKIPSLLISDGIFDWTNSFCNTHLLSMKLKLYHPIIHDYFLCLGEEERMYFENYGIKTFTSMPERVLHQIEKMELPNNNKVLITTANTAYFNEKEKARLIRLMRSIIENLKRKNIKYIFRIYDRELIEELKVEKINNYITGSFKEVLEKVDVVITTPSSITIEAMYHNRAVCQMIYRDVPLFLQSGWSISLSCDIDETLDSLLSPENERINFQEIQIKRYIPDKEYDEIIDEIIDKQVNKKKVFINNNMYNLINSHFNFNFENIFRRIYLKLKKTKIRKMFIRMKGKIK